jgi:DNA-directed RNA polymerase subunit RPC12/RpoP
MEDLTEAVITSPTLGTLAVDSFISHCQIMDEYRCIECDKLLSKKGRNGIIAGEIKCTRCKTINII